MKTRLFARLAVVAALAALTQGAVDAQTASLPLDKLVARADVLLRGGASSQALELLDIAVERDPTQYLSLYKRAIIYSSQANGAQKALKDFRAVLQLREYDQARLQIARIHLKSGALEEAKEAVDALLKAHKGHSQGVVLKATIGDASKQVAQAKKAHQKQKWDECIELTTKLFEHAPESTELRELRANCAMAKGDLEAAVGDLTRLAMLSPSTAAATLVRLYRLDYLYLGGDSDTGSRPIKQCLHFDTDSKVCLAAHREYKAIDKDRQRLRNHMEASQWRAALEILTGSKNLVDKVKAALQAAVAAGEPDTSRSELLTAVLAESCSAHVKAGLVRAGAAVCEDLLRRDPNHVDGLVGRGEEQLRKEEYEEAVRTFYDVFEKTGRSRHDLRDRLQRAQKLLKRSKAKDYYKVLGVSKDADERTIKKAYRRATVKAHPDKQGGSEKKMAELNEAYEILSKPELKARYDAGDDPNDPQAQAQQGNPFAHHGGGGQQFFFQQSGGGMPNFFQQAFAGQGQGGGFKFQFQH